MERIANSFGRGKPDAFRSKFDFKLQFQAVQIPSSQWDKSVILLIPAETGKASSRTGKGYVRNGNCQWSEPVIESAWISQDLVSKHYGEKIYQLAVVATGVLQPLTLGETTIDLSKFVDVKSPKTVVLPLKNSHAATVLHVKVHCVTSIPASRESEQQKKLGSSQEYQCSLAYDEDKPDFDISENHMASSVGASMNQQFWNGQRTYSNPMKHFEEAQGRLASQRKLHRDSAARSSSESLDSFNVGTGSSRGSKPLSRQESSGSSDGGVKRGVISYGNWSSRLQSPQRSSYANGGLREQGSENGSREEVDEATLVPELGSDVKFNLELETVKQKLAIEMKLGAELGMEILALKAERDSLKADLTKLRNVRMASHERETDVDHARVEVKDARHTIIELREELAHQKEANANLNVQLLKTRDCNLELVSAVTELEEALEDQAKELKRLTEEVNSGGSQLTTLMDAEYTWNSSTSSDCEQRRQVEEGLELDWREKFMALEEKLNKKESDVRRLEDEVSTLRNRADSMHLPYIKEDKKLGKSLLEWMQSISEKDSEIQRLERELLSSRGAANGVHEGETEVNLLKIIGNLHRENTELERDCKELTDENIDLMDQLKRAKQMSQLAETTDRIDFDGTNKWHNESSLETQKLQSELEKYRLDIILLEKNLKNLTEDSHFLKNEVDRMQAEISDKDAQLEDLQRSLQKKEGDLESTFKKLEELGKSNKDMLLRISAQEEELQSSEMTLKEFRKEAQTQLEAALIEATDLRREVLEMSDSKHILELQLQACEAELADMNSLLGERDLEISMLNLEVANLVSRERELEAEKSAGSEDLEKALSSLSYNLAHVQELERQLALLEGRLTSLSEEKLHSTTRIRELELRVSSLTDEIRALDDSMVETEASASSLKNERQGLNENLETEQEENSVLRARVEDLSEQVVALTALIDSQSSASQSLECVITGLDWHKHGLENHLLGLEEEKLRLLTGISKSEAQLLQMTEEAESYKLAEKTVNSHIVDMTNEKEQLKTILQEKVHEQDQLVSELERKLGVALREANDHYQAKCHLEQDLHHSKNDLLTMDTSKRELEAELSTLRDSHTHIVALLQDAKESCTSYMEEIASLQADIDRFQKAAHGKERKLQEEISALVALNSLLEKRWANADESLTKLQEENTAVTESLQKELQFSAERLSSSYNEISELRAEKSQLVVSLKEAQDRLHELEEARFAMNGDNLLEDDAVRAKQRDLEVSELRAEKSQLLVSLKEAQDRLHKLEEAGFAMNRDNLLEDDAVREKQRDLEEAIRNALMDMQRMRDTVEADFAGKVQELESKLTQVEEDKELLLKWNMDLSNDVAELSRLGTHINDVKVEMKQRRFGKTAADASFKELLDELQKLRAENTALQILEKDIKAKEEELDIFKREFRVREYELCGRIEELEISNKQLAARQVDPGVDQLKSELIRLQRRSSCLSRKEQELLSQCNIVKVLQAEVSRLQEENDQLEHRFLKFLERDENPEIMEKVFTLEMELAEALEAKNMYKLQLKEVLEAQNSVNMGTLRELGGDMEQVVQDFEIYKRKACELEEELQEMHQRYSLMSLQFAQVEAERGELVIAMKNLRNGQKAS